MSIYFNNSDSPLGELFEIFKSFDIDAIRQASMTNTHLPLVMPWHYAEARYWKNKGGVAFGLAFPAAYNRVIKFLNALKKYNESIYAGHVRQAAESYCRMLFYLAGSYVCVHGTDGLTLYMKGLLDDDIARNDYDCVDAVVKQYARVQVITQQDTKFCFEQMWIYMMRLGGIDWAKKTVRSWRVLDKYKDDLNASYQLAKTNISKHAGQSVNGAEA